MAELRRWARKVPQVVLQRLVTSLVMNGATFSVKPQTSTIDSHQRPAVELEAVSALCQTVPRSRVCFQAVSAALRRCKYRTGRSKLRVGSSDPDYLAKRSGFGELSPPFHDNPPRFTVNLRSIFIGHFRSCKATSVRSHLMKIPAIILLKERKNRCRPIRSNCWMTATSFSIR